jgi:ABC-type transport system substrate-binding protein
MWTSLVNSLLSEIDPAKQQQLYSQLNDFILDQSFTVALTTYPYTFLMRSGVHDVGYLMHNGGLNLQQTWLA